MKLWQFISLWFLLFAIYFNLNRIIELLERLK
jgi:hypothetical protein